MKEATFEISDDFLKNMKVNNLNGDN